MIESLIAAWWNWMVTTTWQVALLVVIVAVIDRLIRRWAWPQVRHALWLLVLIKLVIPPGWALPTAVIPLMGERIAGAVGADRGGAELGWGDQAQASAAVRGSVEHDPTAPGATPSQPAAERGSVQPAPWPFPWRAALFVVWLAGMAVLATALVYRTEKLARWHREQERRPTIPEWFYDVLIRTSRRLGLDRVPAIVFSEEAVTPAVYGVLRPVLLLPARYTDELDEDEAEHVLLHELAHLKRGDLYVQAAILVLQVVYWFNPFVALTRRQIKHVREICCDLTVADLLEEDTVAYRKTLLSTARNLLTESVQPSLGLLGVFEEPYKLVSRMRWLERDTWRRHRMMVATAAAVLVLAAPVVLPTAVGVAPVAEAAEGVVTASLEQRPAEPVRTDGEYTVVRSAFREERRVMGVAVDSRQLAISETWIGDGIIAATERNRTTIVDLKRSRLTFIDHGAEIWVETPLPLDLASILSDEMQRRWRGIRTTGTVEPTRERERILGCRCSAYEVTSWNTTGGGRLTNETTFKVWVSTEVPFDLELLDALLLNLRILYNRDEAYRGELAKMPGLQMRLELRQGNLLSGTWYVDEVIEMATATPPPGTFTPPEGYRRVDRIEQLDL